MLRKLNNEEVKEIYNTYLVNDFPASEVKSLKRILEGISDDQYFACGYEEGGELKGYTYFIKSKTGSTLLLDYLAVLKDKRSSGIGSRIMTAVQEMAQNEGKHLILEVENPDYEKPGENRDYMIKRIEFYKKNNIRLSNVTCRFYGNEYRILYGGDFADDMEIEKEIDKIYREFFGDDFINKYCRIHERIIMEQQSKATSRQDIAESYFRKGYNCAQSVFAAFAKDYGFDEETALKISASFGGGLGRMREVCGCVSAMAIIAGMETGSTKERDAAGKQRNYEMVQHLAEEYKKISGGSIICRELLGLDKMVKGADGDGLKKSKTDTSPKPSDRTEAYYKKRPCIELIRSACTIIENEFFGGRNYE